MNFINFLCSSSASFAAVSLFSICFWRSYSFNFFAYSVFFVMMYCRIASLSNKNPSFLLVYGQNKSSSRRSKVIYTKLNSRNNWIPAWLQCQRTAIEALHRILANALLIRAIAGLGCITLLLMVRIHCASRTISRVTCHLNENQFKIQIRLLVRILRNSSVYFSIDFCHLHYASMLIY